MKTRKIFVAMILLLALAAFGSLLVYNTNLYDSLMKARIAGQLEKRYGMEFEVREMDDKQGILPDFKAKMGFVAYSKEGICMLGECDWSGKVVSESYMHYYYAPCTIHELDGIIGDCFDEYRIVRDCINFMGNLALTELVDVKTVSSEKEYLDYVDRRTLCFRVYLKDSVSDNEIQKAIDAMAEAHYEGNVYFMPVAETLLQELKASEWECYYPKSGMEDKVAQDINSMDQQQIIKLVYDPGDFIRMSYVPKWNKE